MSVVRDAGSGTGTSTGAGPRFGARLAAAMDEHGPLCVGIDPHPALLAQWGLRDDVAGLRRFSMTVVEALGGRVAALKPQAAFFERHGSAGVAVLEEVLASVLGRAGLTQVVLDAKRGDIGSTMAGYADAYLREGAPLACDALTVSPFLGFGSLAPAVAAARASRRGLFVLALTSNPEGASVQHAVPASIDAVPADAVQADAVSADAVSADAVPAVRQGHAAGAPGVVSAVHVRGPASVAGRIAEQAAALNAAELDEDPAALGSVGLVVGATTGTAVQRLGIDLSAVRGPLLAPGVGAQGGGPTELAEVFGAARRAVLASTSRAVLRAGPGLEGLRAAASSAAEDAARALGR